MDFGWLCCVNVNSSLVKYVQLWWLTSILGEAMACAGAGNIGKIPVPFSQFMLVNPTLLQKQTVFFKKLRQSLKTKKEYFSDCTYPWGKFLNWIKWARTRGNRWLSSRCGRSTLLQLTSYLKFFSQVSLVYRWWPPENWHKLSDFLTHLKYRLSSPLGWSYNLFFKQCNFQSESGCY